MHIVSLSNQDIPTVVRLHRKVLGDTVNARVGEWFLQYLYSQLLQLPNLATVLIAKDEDQIVGFISAAKDYRLLSGQLMAALSIKQKMIIGWFLITHPTLWLAFLQQRMFGSYVQRHLPDPLSYILTFGVNTNQQGKGVGRLLMDAMVTELQAPTNQAIYLDTKKSNAAAIHFYERYGFQIVQRFAGNVLCRLQSPK